MEKICISTNSEKIKLYLESADILNEFYKRGFEKRGGFMGVVQDCNADFKSYENIKKLEAFWSLRVQDETFNTQLRAVLDTIETEILNPIENE